MKKINSKMLRAGYQLIALSKNRIGDISGIVGLGYPALIAHAYKRKQGVFYGHGDLGGMTERRTLEGYKQLQKWLFEHVRPTKIWIQKYQIPMDYLTKYGFYYSKKYLKKHTTNPHKPALIKAIYDNGGKTFDRLTVVLDKMVMTANKNYHAMLGLSLHPDSPQGYSQWGEGVIGSHLGKKIKWSQLSIDVQKHIINRMKK